MLTTFRQSYNLSGCLCYEVYKINDMWKHRLQCFCFNLSPVWEFYCLLAFVNFITLITLRWFGQFITSRQLFLVIKLIAFLYISNSKRTGAELWNSQTGFKLKKKHYRCDDVKGVESDINQESNESQTECQPNSLRSGSSSHSVFIGQNTWPGTSW